MDAVHLVVDSNPMADQAMAATTAVDTASHAAKERRSNVALLKDVVLLGPSAFAHPHPSHGERLREAHVTGGGSHAEQQTERAKVAVEELQTKLRSLVRKPLGTRCVHSETSAHVCLGGGGRGGR